MNDDKLPQCWTRPVRAEHKTQGLLFRPTVDEVLNEEMVTTSDLRRWKRNGWLSIDIDQVEHLDLIQENEIRFIRQLVMSGLGDSFIDRLLSELPSPCRYEPDSIAYHFEFGWVTPTRDSPFEIIEDNIDEWLSSLSEARLLGLSKKIEECLDELEDDDSEVDDSKLLTNEIAEQCLASFNSLELSEFTAIEDTAAEILRRFEGALHLGDLTNLSDAAAESLSKHEGVLYLDGLTNLSHAVADSLSKHKGRLSLNGLTNLSDDAAESLSRHEGYLIYDGEIRVAEGSPDSPIMCRSFLYLNGLACLSDAAAESLSKHEGTLCLTGLTSLSDVAAERLSKHEGDLYLQLNNLPKSAADILCSHPSLCPCDEPE